MLSTAERLRRRREWLLADIEGALAVGNAEGAARCRTELEAIEREQRALDDAEWSAENLGTDIARGIET